MNEIILHKATWDELKAKIVAGHEYYHRDNTIDNVRAVFVFDDSRNVLVDRHRIVDSGHPHYSGSECEEYDNSYIDSAGLKHVFDEDKNQKVTIQPSVENAVTVISHNWCDPTAWAEESIYVTGQILLPKASGDLTVFEFPQVNIIDAEHGKIAFEDRDLDDTYRVDLYEDGVVVPFSQYEINYRSGDVTFTGDKSGEITSNYRYENGSSFTLKPSSGKKFKFINVELQFSYDIDFGISGNKINFDTWVYNPYDLPNKFMYRRTSYKKMKDFIDESNNTDSRTVDPIGELTKEVVIFAWNYPASKILKSSQGTEMRISIDNDIPIKSKTDGEDTEIATVTFYGIEEDDQ